MDEAFQLLFVELAIRRRLHFKAECAQTCGDRCEFRILGRFAACKMNFVHTWESLPERLDYLFRFRSPRKIRRIAAALTMTERPSPWAYVRYSETSRTL